MSNHSNKSGETLSVAILSGLAGLVGLLILVQLIRAKPVDVPSMLIISVCFVIAVVITALWGRGREPRQHSDF